MILADFLIGLRGTGAAGHTSRHKDIIKVGTNITFHMVLRVASRSQFLAGLMAKLSIVGGRYAFAISRPFEIMSSPLVTFNFKTFPKHR